MNAEDGVRRIKKKEPRLHAVVPFLLMRKMGLEPISDPRKH